DELKQALGLLVRQPDDLRDDARFEALGSSEALDLPAEPPDAARVADRASQAKDLQPGNRLQRPPHRGDAVQHQVPRGIEGVPARPEKAAAEAVRVGSEDDERSARPQDAARLRQYAERVVK